ncbi:hypothetical protein JCM33374_g2007 [Metschnikowia sp. JCM 33374]|nr:hypothetical protein JCM33374_g2007 [Metschnikowia sp. JCM 33374]
MNLVLLFTFACAATAWSFPQYGTLFISKIGSADAHQFIGIIDSTLDDRGDTLMSVSQELGTIGPAFRFTYLGVMDGKFALVGAEDDHFQLVPKIITQAGSVYGKILSYMNSTDFTLCGDHSIGVQRECEGAVPITIELKGIFD